MSRTVGLPAFGRMPLDRVGAQEVAAWFDAASGDKSGAANRAFEILRAMMFRAEEWGLRERDTNPCLGIAKNPRKRIARFLDADELARLGRALDSNEARWPEAVAAIRLLALTGCRRSEVLDLRWRDIGNDAINLRDSKTGPRAVPLGEAARTRIVALSGARNPGAFLFARYAEGRGAYSLETCWRTVCDDARLGKLRLHDLRTPPRVRRSCRAKVSRWSADSSGTGGTGLRRATLTSPTRTLSRRRRRSEASLRSR